MSRGKRLDLFVGAHIGDGWSEVEEERAVEPGSIEEPSKHMLVFKKEKRRGKTITLTGPFCLKKEDAHSLMTTLKKKLGSGGSYREPWMEFQGECMEKLRILLEDEGFRFKKKS